MPGSAAMAGIAASQAAIAEEAAHRAEVARCKLNIQQFDSQHATVAEMQDYAGCVETVYPQPMNGAEIMAAKAAFVVALVGLAIGAYRGKRGRYGDWGDAVMFGLLGFVLLPFLVGVVLGILYGCYWLVT